VAWDLANDGIFGVGSSGASGESIRGLLQANLTGPALVSGGSAGVEASVIAVIVTLAASIYVIRIAQKKKQNNEINAQPSFIAGFYYFKRESMQRENRQTNSQYPPSDQFSWSNRIQVS
jgi:uncharacterized spore protein YtfJ